MLRRHGKNGGQEHWAVSGESGALTVHHSRRENGHGWQTDAAGPGCADLAEALVQVPGLRVLEAGAISEYTVDPAAMEPPVLVGLLQAPTEGGAETAAGWPDEVASPWEDSDSSLEDWRFAMNWFPRWARVNDTRVSVINLGSADRLVLQPVLADEADEELVPIREVARSSWSSESGGAPISWGGGYALSLLAPGLGHSRPFGDIEPGDAMGDPFPTLPEPPQELGEALAGWVIDTEAEVSAALALEELDPDGVTSPAERQAWEERVDAVTVWFHADVNEEAELALREHLARGSELYRRTRDGLAHPLGPDGKALAAALDGALTEGLIAAFVQGEWD